MNERYKISIVIPVYNAAAYIGKCIESVLAQTYHNFELILVNDGSSDQSNQICEKYCAIDNRVTHYYKTNGGASSARNYGMRMSKGIFVVFIDSDDYVKESYLEDLISVFDGNPTTLVIAGMTINAKGNTFTFQYKDEIVNDNLVKDLSDKEIYRHGGPTSKLYNLGVIKSNNLSFNENICNYEDLLFCLSYLAYVDKIIYSSSVAYVYQVRNSSLSLKSNSYDGEMELYSSYLEKCVKLDRDYKITGPKLYAYSSTFLFRAVLALSDSGRRERERWKNYKQVYNLLMTYEQGKMGARNKIMYGLLKSKQYALLELFVKVLNIKRKIWI